jgi:hypothetical protein
MWVLQRYARRHDVVTLGTSDAATWYSLGQQAAGK